MNRIFAQTLLCAALVATMTCEANGGSRIGQSRINEKLDLSVFAVRPAVPPTFALTHSLFGQKVELSASKDIEPDIVKRECDYTMRWVNKAVAGSFRPNLMTDSGVRLMRRINGKDDGAYQSYALDFETLVVEPTQIDIVDARDLNVLIRVPGLSRISIESIIRKYINWAGYGDEYKSTLSITENHMLNGSCSYGRFTVDQKGATGWFTVPVEWCRDGDAVLFVFKKEVSITPAKGPPVPANRLGGMEFDDPRTLLRFENSNRAAIAAEYAARKSYLVPPGNLDDAKPSDPSAIRNAPSRR